MITAREARFKSKNGELIKEIKSDIETAINEAVEEGQFNCIVSFRISSSDEVRDHIKEDMEKLGYKVKMTDERESNAPCDQAPWYDYITLEWGGEDR